MTLRSCGRETVPITGPRSRAVAAPHRIGKLSLPPGAGCEVIRMWSTRLERFIAVYPSDLISGHFFESRPKALVRKTLARKALAPNDDGPPEQTGLSPTPKFTA